MKLEKLQLLIALVLCFKCIIEAKYTWNGKEWAWHEDKYISNYQTTEKDIEGSGQEDSSIFIDEEENTDNGSGTDTILISDILVIVENLQKKAQDLTAELSELKSYLDNKATFTAYVMFT